MQNKGIISDKPKEGEKDPRDSISDFTKKGGPEDENPVKENKKNDAGGCTVEKWV